MRPDAAKLHNPDPEYLKMLLEQSGLSRSEAARRIGLSYNALINYLRDPSEPLYRKADYRTQFALECLAKSLR